MEEFELEEYFRFKNGNIAKLNGKDSRYLWFDKCVYKNSGIPVYDLSLNNKCDMDFIAKHSKNIIDLIEVGDFVNGIQVVEILPQTFGRCYSIELANHYIIARIDWNKVEKILTKEQYEANCYEVVK